MMKKAFTLIEVILGLFLLGLISATTLPILTSSLLNISKSKIKLEMNYIGEMTMERIKSYDDEYSSETYIFNKELLEIIESFRNQSTAEIILNIEEKGENYKLKINKGEKSDRLWMIEVFVYHDEEGSNLKHVEYKTYMLQK